MMIKRIFDVVVSLTLLVLFLPLMLLISVLILLESDGPVFYLGNRVGIKMSVFRIVKFRTMVKGADNAAAYSIASDDQRVTRIGRILREYHLDELPQLMNILKGEMSLVGPRPEVPEYVKLFTEREKRILSVRPGITDYASIKFYSLGKILCGTKNPERMYIERIRPKKLELQLKYVKEHSFWIDLKIILATIKTILIGGDGGSATLN